MEHVSRIIGSIADVSVATGKVASLLLNQTGGLAATTSSAVQSVSASTLSVGQAVWVGVDLHNMSGSHRVASLVVDDAIVLEHWLSSNASVDVVGCTEFPASKQLWINTARQISVELPFLHASDQFIRLDGQ